MSCYEYMTKYEIEKFQRIKADQESKKTVQKKRNIFLRTLVAIGVLTITTGCATITNGTRQDIIFAVPEHQVCAVSRVDGVLGSVQASSPTITVERNRHPITLDCGGFVKVYEPEINPAGYTSIGLIDFGLVDFATGALWEYGEVGK